MARIVLGSDHRGGKLAYSLLLRFWFRNAENLFDVSTAKEMSLVGVFQFDSELKNTEQSKFVGSHFQPLLTTKDLFVENGESFNERQKINSNGIPTAHQALVPSNDFVTDQTPFDLYQGNDSSRPVDYPEIAALVAERVSRHEADFGILVSKTGTGMCIVANKFPDVRAAYCHNELTADLSRRHNDANVLCLSGELAGTSTSLAIVKKWLTTEYTGGRHQIRLDKIRAIEKRTGL